MVPTSREDELVVEVSRRIDHWNNGKIYKELHGRSPRMLPRRRDERPSREALLWHAEKKFR